LYTVTSHPKGLLYQRSVTPISKQRSSGHIGDVAQPLAQTFTVSFTTLPLYHPGKCLGILERGAFVGTRNFLKVAI
jgi:hypothetical protein